LRMWRQGYMTVCLAQSHRNITSLSLFVHLVLFIVPPIIRVSHTDAIMRCRVHSLAMLSINKFRQALPVSAPVYPYSLLRWPL